MRLAFWADFYYLSEPLVAYRWHSANHSSRFSSPWSQTREEIRTKAALVRRLSHHSEIPVALIALAVVTRFAQKTRTFAANRLRIGQTILEP